MYAFDDVIRIIILYCYFVREADLGAVMMEDATLTRLYLGSSAF